MANTLAWHSTVETAPPVYHDDTHCPEGDDIELEHRRRDTGGRPPCEHCARF